MNTENLKPGRELDALVATKVMGRDPGYLDGEPTCPSYSTNISAAWELVEEIKPTMEEWTWFSISGITNVPDGKREYFVTFYDAATCGISDSLPHAICLAALKAVGHG